MSGRMEISPQNKRKASPGIDTSREKPAKRGPRKQVSQSAPGTHLPLPQGLRAAFPTLDDSSVAEEKRKYGIKQLMEAKFDGSTHKWKESVARLNAKQNNSSYPEGYEAGDQVWYDDLMAQMADDDEEIPTTKNTEITFQSLYPSLRQKIMVKIAEEARIDYHSADYVLMSLLDLNAAQLRKIKRGNTDVWGGSTVLPQHLRQLKDQYPEAVVDPDMPPPGATVHAANYLRQERMPLGLLGLWEPLAEESADKPWKTVAEPYMQDIFLPEVNLNDGIVVACPTKENGAPTPALVANVDHERRNDNVGNGYTALTPNSLDNAVEMTTSAAINGTHTAPSHQNAQPEPQRAMNLDGAPSTLSTQNQMPFLDDRGTRHAQQMSQTGGMTGRSPVTNPTRPGGQVYPTVRRRLQLTNPRTVMLPNIPQGEQLTAITSTLTPSQAPATSTGDTAPASLDMGNGQDPSIATNQTPVDVDVSYLFDDDLFQNPLGNNGVDSFDDSFDGSFMTLGDDELQMSHAEYRRQASENALPEFNLSPEDIDITALFPSPAAQSATAPATTVESPSIPSTPAVDIQAHAAKPAPAQSTNASTSTVQSLSAPPTHTVSTQATATKPVPARSAAAYAPQPSKKPGSRVQDDSPNDKQEQSSRPATRGSPTKNKGVQQGPATQNTAQEQVFTRRPDGTAVLPNNTFDMLGQDMLGFGMNMKMNNVQTPMQQYRPQMHGGEELLLQTPMNPAQLASAHSRNSSGSSQHSNNSGPRYPTPPDMSSTFNPALQHPYYMPSSGPSPSMTPTPRRDSMNGLQPGMMPQTLVQFPYNMPGYGMSGGFMPTPSMPQMPMGPQQQAFPPNMRMSQNMQMSSGMQGNPYNGMMQQGPQQNMKPHVAQSPFTPQATSLFDMNDETLDLETRNKLKQLQQQAIALVQQKRVQQGQKFNAQTQPQQLHSQMQVQAQMQAQAQAQMQRMPQAQMAHVPMNAYQTGQPPMNQPRLSQSPQQAPVAGRQQPLTPEQATRAAMAAQRHRDAQFAQQNARLSESPVQNMGPATPQRPQPQPPILQQPTPTHQPQLLPPHIPHVRLPNGQIRLESGMRVVPAQLALCYAQACAQQTGKPQPLRVVEGRDFRGLFVSAGGQVARMGEGGGWVLVARDVAGFLKGIGVVVVEQGEGKGVETDGVKEGEAVPAGGAKRKRKAGGDEGGVVKKAKK